MAFLQTLLFRIFFIIGKPPNHPLYASILLFYPQHVKPISHILLFFRLRFKGSFFIMDLSTNRRSAMRYDFTTVMDRMGHDAIAVDALGHPSVPGMPKEGFDAIPMWVADMNFPTVPTIVEAITLRAQHPAYGYFSPRPEYYDSITDWHRRRNGVEALEAKHIGYANGVLGGVVAALNVLCSRGDKVLLHAPTYIGFTHSLEDNGYHIVHSPLVLDAQGVWRMDFEDMERKIVENKIHAAIFCSPHNPCGRVWERWEIEQAMAIYKKHDVYVISDEIWSDLILNGHQHIPTQSVSEDAKMRTVAMYAPSKTFNLAGLVGSYSIVYNSWLKDRMDKEISLSHTNAMNVLSMHALIGAYKDEGHIWVDELRQVLTENVDFACDFIEKNWEGITVSKPQGTYMLFVDCTKWCEAHRKTLDDVLKTCHDVGVAVQDGRPFHGACHIRMNLALPLSRVQEAFRRMDQYVFKA
jgi:cystathionine beta-lyase